MKPRVAKTALCRKPSQLRARQTVDAVLDAVARILKRGGSEAVTTNRIAEVAGVSIGSVYQYFPDKQAIFAALHQRHIDQIDTLIQNTLVRHAASPLRELVRALVEAMVDIHAADPRLYERLHSEVPHRAGGILDFSVRLHGAFRLALASRAHELKKRRDLDKAAFIVANTVESLSHGAVLRRPPEMSLEEAKEEAIEAIMAYLSA